MALEWLSIPLSQWFPNAEVHKVPEPANLVRRKFWKISLLAENFDKNLRVENTETFLSHVYFILNENLLYILFS